MNISIFGLGYVGAVSSACLAEAGHRVIGIDPNKVKVDLINQGRCPIVEPHLQCLTEQAVASHQLQAIDSAGQAIADTELSIVCVGTPSRDNGSLDLKHLRTVCEEIGTALANKTSYHVVVIRSTILPGTIRDVVTPILEAASGKLAGKDFGLCHNPEFLREGTAVEDYRHPPKTVIGELDSRSGDALAELYADLDAPLFRIPIEIAEMVKYTDNVWHALKVAFANEIGTVCKSVDIDSHKVMEVFCADEKLNLSASYLKPGFAFGGSCLPKDLRALCYRAKTLDLTLPVISSILPSNEQQISRGLSLITQRGRKRIGFLGLSFKAGTDDLRESPLVELIERLLGKGFEVKVYDEHVNLAKIVGANRDFILNQIPHISNLMVDDTDEIIEHAEVLVVGNRSEQFAEVVAAAPSSTLVVDLVRVMNPLPDKSENYDGICW